MNLSWPVFENQGKYAMRDKHRPVRFNICRGGFPLLDGFKCAHIWLIQNEAKVMQCSQSLERVEEGRTVVGDEQEV